MKVMDLEAVIPSQSVWKRYISKVKKLGKIRTEGRHRKKDKTTFPVEVNLSYTELNHKPYVVATVRNIAERKDAESKIKTLAKFPEANLNLVLKLDAQGNVEYANPAAIDAAKRLQVGIMRVLPKEHKKIAAKVVGSDKTISKVSSVKGHSFDFVFKSFKNVQAVFVTGIQRRRKQDKASEKIFRKLSSKYKDMPTKEELEEVFGKR